MEINIPETEEKGNSSLGKRIFTPSLVILAGALVFGSVKLANIESNRQPVTLDYNASVFEAISAPTTTESSSPKTSETAPAKTGTYVAARGGMAYYLPSCAGAKRIAEKNKIWFETKAEAEKFGYKPAQNCPGLK